MFPSFQELIRAHLDWEMRAECVRNELEPQRRWPRNDTVCVCALCMQGMEAFVGRLLLMSGLLLFLQAAPRLESKGVNCDLGSASVTAHVVPASFASYSAPHSQRSACVPRLRHTLMTARDG